MTRILLAEDDHDMRRFLTKALKNAGHDVVSFDNGRSAYERLREEPFTLLLTDIVMPEMDGIELARRATELDPDLRVMSITGFAAVALNPESNAPKDASVLSKPFHVRIWRTRRRSCSPPPSRWPKRRSSRSRTNTSASSTERASVGVFWTPD